MQLQNLKLSLSYQKVIGDKAGRAAAWAMKTRNAEDSIHLLEKTAGAKVKFLHVVRNPFDNIATMVLQDKNIMARYEEHKLKVRSNTIHVSFAEGMPWSTNWTQAVVCCRLD